MKTWIPSLAGLLALGVGALLSLPSEDPFPHADHVGLFPTCLGCHRGIPTEEAALVFSVTSEDCASCHDGERLERVDWAAPTVTATNVRFDHADHTRAVQAEGDEALACGACHAIPGSTARMEVEAAASAACLACHAHDAEAHLAVDSECGVCHETLADAGALSEIAIASFPEPPDHLEPGFLLAHGEVAEQAQAQCVFCHARESCARCHVNAEQVPSIVSLPTDVRVAALMADEPGEWPTPPSHDRADWAVAHGAVGAAVESCANCHARPSCADCHGEAAAFLAELPMPPPGGPEGVRTVSVSPAGHTPAFVLQHGPAAAVGLPNCSSCHLEAECTACHQGAATGEPPPPLGKAPLAEGAPSPASARHEEDVATTLPSVLPAEPAGGFHPIDFVLRHGAEAYAARTECSECHSTEVFCRTCHENQGFGAEGAVRAGGFHDAQPDWLLAHGQAARQGLEECASCHQQNSCLRCHSARFGLRINPHGPGFDPQRVAERSVMSCARCHFADDISPFTR